MLRWLFSKQSPSDRHSSPDPNPPIAPEVQSLLAALAAPGWVRTNERGRPVAKNPLFPTLTVCLYIGAQVQVNGEYVSIAKLDDREYEAVRQSLNQLKEFLSSKTLDRSKELAKLEGLCASSA